MNTFFDESNADLPLFSGTPMRAVESRFRKVETPEQFSLLTCRSCGDGGWIKVNGNFHLCQCKAGKRESVVLDALALSGSTLATLTGYADFERQDVIQAEFADFVRFASQVFDTWQSAWSAYLVTRPDLELAIEAD